MAWTIRATGMAGGMIADVDELKRAVKLFADPDLGFELMALAHSERGLRGVHRVLSGSDVEGIAEAASELPSGIGVYFRINPVPLNFSQAAKNNDIVKRLWIYIDVDPVKAEEGKDDPATDFEKGPTGEIADSLVEYLSEREWPSPVVVDSGNGWGLFYRCDLPNDKITQATLRQLLKMLSEKFSGTKGIIDKSVHNANRLAKLPGTWARKGTASDDRPHRPCRFVHIPDEIQSVTFELLTKTSGEFEDTETISPSENGTYRTPRTHYASPAGRTEAYARKALDNECARVALSLSPAQGGDGRNNSLNRAAFSLGQLVAGGLLSRGEVERRLTEAALHAGLASDDGGESGITKTIQSGLNAGMLTPRTIPESNDPKAKIGTTKIERTPGESLTVKLSNVAPMAVEWLIKDRIPKRFITIFAGRTGVGKSFVSHDLIARLSSGREIPFAGGECFNPGGTLILSEDSHEYVLVPRLMEAGSDLTKIHAMTWKAMGQYHLGNTDMLTEAVAEVDGGVSLVMIDPPTNFLADTDEHKNSEIRQLVMKVVEWALERDLAVLFILHVNKQTGKGIEALNRVMGSVAWVTTARIAHTFCADPETPGQCLWVPLKNNLGPLTKALAYKIESADGMAKVNWISEVDTTADEALGHATPRARRDVAASEWLVKKFKEKLQWSSDDLFRDAAAENISRSAVFDAKKILDPSPKARKTTLENGDVVFVWYVSEDWPYLLEEPDSSSNSP